MKLLTVRQDDARYIHIQRTRRATRLQQLEGLFYLWLGGMLGVFMLSGSSRVSFEGWGAWFLLNTVGMLLFIGSIWLCIDSFQTARQQYAIIHTFDTKRQTYAENGGEGVAFNQVASITVQEETRSSGKSRYTAYVLNLRLRNRRRIVIDEYTDSFDILCAADVIAGIVGCSVNYVPLKKS